jgi:hypothetical protein
MIEDDSANKLDVHVIAVKVTIAVRRDAQAEKGVPTTRDWTQPGVQFV